ncbi:MAG: dUTP diphosphatase [Pseudomonadota bacterium]
MSAVSVQIQRVPGADPAVPLPRYETPQSAGMDMRANFPDGARGGLALAPGARVLVPTGLAFALPEGFEVQVRPRSGLALKQGITLVNSPGTIDADYRGEVGVIVLNTGSETVQISHGDRIAQIVLAPVVQAAWEEVETLDETSRGRGGFGSTGV